VVQLLIDFTQIKFSFNHFKPYVHQKVLHGILVFLFILPLIIQIWQAVVD